MELSTFIIFMKVNNNCNNFLDFNNDWKISLFFCSFSLFEDSVYRLVLIDCIGSLYDSLNCAFDEKNRADDDNFEVDELSVVLLYLAIKLSLWKRLIREEVSFNGRLKPVSIFLRFFILLSIDVLVRTCAF